MREEYLRGDQESLSPGDKEIEKALRPLSFDDFTGQKRRLKTSKFLFWLPKKEVSLWTMFCSMGLPALERPP